MSRRKGRNAPRPPAAAGTSARDWRSHAALFAVFVLAALLLYQPAWHGTPVWDDDGHLTRADLASAGGLARIWTEPGATQQYYPVTHSAFWLMNELWGHAPLGYHLVTIALHGILAALIVLVLRRLAVPGALLAGALFLVHPVHVESVAWISEVKNTLSGVLYMAAALAYLEFDRSRRRVPYAAALALFTLAVLAKSVTASLPAALLVVFWWQRGRLTHADAVPLAPFFAVAVAAALVTPYVEARFIGASGEGFALTPVQRLLVAGRASWFYLATLAWPVNLAFIYEKWTVDGAWWQFLFPIGIAALGAAAFVRRERSRAPLAALLLFVGTLFPALGFVTVYPFRYAYVANHFVYLASVPVLALAAAVAAAPFARLVRAAPVRAGLALALIAPLALLTWRHSRDFRDVETLYAATLEANPRAWLAYTNLAEIELQRPQPDLGRAVDLLRRALAIEAGNAEAHNNLGVAYQRLGRFEEAYLAHAEAVRHAPAYADAHSNLGAAALSLERPVEAQQHLERALTLRPDFPHAHYNLGNVYLATGAPTQAAQAFETALRYSPSYAAAANNLGMARERLGRWAEAADAYEVAARLDRSALVLNNLGFARLRQGQPEVAVTHFTEAIRLDPRYAPAHRHLGDAFADLNRLDDAVAAYRAALAVEPPPGTAETHNNLGIALAMLGRGADAARHFTAALQIRPDFEDARRNLARVRR